MRRFRYRLDRLLRYRRSLAQRERIRLAERVGALNREEEHKVRLQKVRNETLVRRLRALETGLTAREMGNLHYHLLRVEEAIDRTELNIRNAEIEVEKARAELVKRRRDERAIELHRDRRWKVWLRDYNRDESRTLDDMATVRHVRGASA